MKEEIYYTGQFAMGQGVDGVPEIYYGILPTVDVQELHQAIPGVAHLFAVSFGGRHYLQVAIDERGEIISFRKVPVLVPKDER